ncbi:BaiN/RdsA family NAD(P)/FAD-dependent oxidoreductase [Luteirhabdus pelagi]|uniref:NAD(P)/FAD-dependent oxidoreductase n=1 Tax=Luteirhabdus pelagi TaxID=2792783 RepID=UPI00193A39E1|nr:NAD(P)/FAD-dependent oxidoreductase [Luteirhabdus pelagi]
MISADVIIVGGGAAGFFTAINLAEQKPNLKIIILERGKEVLTKVKISGGGRCNVTHAEFLPKELVEQYPRGKKELLGPFHTFMTGDTVGWFEEKGIPLKTEEDGRMFPITDDSQTIIDCFLNEANRLGVEVLTGHSVQEVTFDDEYWHIETKEEQFVASAVVVATGSNPKIWKLLKRLGHTIISPVPSLFTFNIQDSRIEGLAGVSTPATIRIEGLSNTSLEADGPLLITHWGMSGPAILKLSAWGARDLAEVNYQFFIKVNWLMDVSAAECAEMLKELKLSLAKKQVTTHPQFDLPKRLWKRLVAASKIEKEANWAHLSNADISTLAQQLTNATFQVEGKSTFKEEFVTAGGVDLVEVDFKTFESKKHRNLYLAGEVLNIDAVTGGFNFQNAWTGGFMVANAISDRL